MQRDIVGFSKLAKEEKIKWICKTFFSENQSSEAVLRQYWNDDKGLQQIHDEFIENTVSNFYFPLGVAPNFRIDQKLYTVPMVIEESSVVAAASSAAKFWNNNGGFKTTIIGTKKVGHVHFSFLRDFDELQLFFESIKTHLITQTDFLTVNMRQRGGGIESIELKDKSDKVDHYYQLEVIFDTVDSMGANFINSCLEKIASTLLIESNRYFEDGILEVDMSILSNFTPNCLVRAQVSCPIERLTFSNEPYKFAKRFKRAIDIANQEPYRAVTHNKGIMNGVDAVVIATGNDFRAIEAACHAYAAKDGGYRSLSQVDIRDEVFTFSIELPLALGTVGGLTKLHPLVKFCHELLGNPNAKQLMRIVASVGLAQNFSAVQSLITSGIQKGHMKMHLNNILNQNEASEYEKKQAIKHFDNQEVSNQHVKQFIDKLRNDKSCYV